MARIKTQPNPTAPPAEVLTLSEAAAYLRIGEEALRKLATEQAVPARQIGDEWRFSKAALQAWLGQPCFECRRVQWLLAELEERLATQHVAKVPPANARGAKERVLKLAGVWKDDPTVPALLREIYEARGRPVNEEDE
jgi:excisionase family DNA binding protein